jgi:hypothetical protein
MQVSKQNIVEQKEIKKKSMQAIREKLNVQRRTRKKA